MKSMIRFAACILLAGVLSLVSSAFAQTGREQPFNAGASAIRFYGAGSGGYRDNAIAENCPAELSLAMWINYTGTSQLPGLSTATVLGFGNTQTTPVSLYDQNIGIDDHGRLTFFVSDAATHLITSLLAYNDGRWHHVVATLSRSTGMRLYVDGAQVAQDASVTTPAPKTGWWRLGSVGLAGRDSFSGALDEIRIYSRPLTAADITGLATGDAGVVSTSGLLSYWACNERKGIVLSSSSPAITAQANLVGVNFLNYGQPGVPGGQSVRFDGDTLNQSVFLARRISSPANFSVGLWFKTTNTTGGRLIGFCDSTNSQSAIYDRHLYLDANGVVYFGMVAAGPTAVVIKSLTSAYNDGSWHHVLATYSLSGGRMDLYVDGVRADDRINVASAQSFSGYWRIGNDRLASWPGGNDAPIALSIDEVQIWSIARSQVEYQTSWTNILSGTEPSLEAYLPFIEGSGNTAVDATGHGYTGVFFNSPAWVTESAPPELSFPERIKVGQFIAPPSAAINPGTGKVYQTPSVSGLGADYYWSDLEQRLYPFRAANISITWFTSANLTDLAARIVERGRVAWPTNLQLQVAGSPAILDDASTAYRAAAIRYTSAAGAPGYAYDPLSKALIQPVNATSVIHYVLAPAIPAGGAVASPDLYSNLVQVVRGIAWNDAAFLLATGATVGVKVSDPRGLKLAKSGFVLFTNAPYDGAGSDAAYARTNQSGPIIPVNLPLAGVDSNLVVAFYQANPVTGALWADQPVQFNLSWPTSAPVLNIASTNGLVAVAGAQIYQQANPNLPGYNPNEEHAFIQGGRLYALRNDLNRSDTSSNYVVLKFRHPVTQEWTNNVFRVGLTTDPNALRFPGEAGKELFVPPPISLVNRSGCTAPASGAVFADYLGKLYGRHGPTPEDPSAEAVLTVSYLAQQLNFFTPATVGRTNDPAVVCASWRGQADGGSAATDLKLTYRVQWPSAALPVLQVGETVLGAKHGLPGLKNWARADVVFDSSDPDGALPLSAAARLYDPISARTLILTNVVSGGSRIPSTYRFPPEIKLAATTAGKLTFAGLPYYLRARLTYDPINKSLTFAGSLDESAAGEPLLLNNVLTPREQDRLLQLSTETQFQDIVRALFDLTRNPNRLDVQPRDGVIDQALLVGYATNASGAAVRAQLGSGPKALAATLSPPYSGLFGQSIRFDGSSGYVALPNNVFPYPSAGQGTAPFTFETWFKTSAGGVILGMQNTAPTTQPGGWIPAIYVDTNGLLQVLMLNPAVNVNRFVSATPVNDGAPHHLAAVYNGATVTVYLDGRLAGSYQHGAQSGFAANYYYQIGTGFTRGHPGGIDGWSPFNGELDEVRLWTVARTSNEIASAMNAALSGAELGLKGQWRFEETTGLTALDSSPNLAHATLNGGAARTASTAGSPRYLVLAENNATPLSPVTLHVLRVGTGPFVGDLKVIFPDNIFDERLTLRHSSDFGGDPTGLEFEWYYHPDDGPSVRTNLPAINPLTGDLAEARGWQKYNVDPADGATTLTIGDGGQSSQLLLGDNWFIARYRGNRLGSLSPWSGWVGGPGIASGAQLAPGWVKRVVEGINPFDQRTTNFHASAVNTYASMLIQAGRRYEGDIAFDADGGNLNSIGLIEAYTTTLRRARKLSIDAVPPFEYGPADNAMLGAAGRIADLYMLLGNEAYADAADPTIGYDTSSTYGTAAPSIFAFQNQLDSLLEEELVLLRGRDPSGATVTAPPVYNRLFWNFTHGDGEVAYAQVYNLSDQPGTSPGIDESDARILYPQGHGDAWGHYLTAVTTYYDLLRHPRFTWVPRAENTLVAGVPVTVDYLDERKFAKAAAARARTGAQLVDLTYRSIYVDDPNGQYQGYKDSDATRAWGVSEWARRAGQGAFLDWVTANAILPPNDTSHTGIQKVDRTTVAELDEILAQHGDIQSQLDKADNGLNPLGVAVGAVPFDIDPAGIAAGRTHYEQISARALIAVNNSLTIFNYASQLSQTLRRNQDSQSQIASASADKERDLKNRMIEVFGYPHAGDIGAGGTYPSGYDGPDFYHYMYVNASDLTGEPGVPQTSIVGFYQGLEINGAVTPTDSVKAFPDDVPDPAVLAVPPGGSFQVTYPFSTGDYGLVAPSAWGSRRAPGRLQNNLADLLRAEAKLKQSVVKYDLLLKQIEVAVDLLKEQYDLNTDKIVAKSTEFGVATTLSAIRIGLKSVSITAKRAGELGNDITDATTEAIPRIVGLSADAFSAVRAGIKVGATTVKNTYGLVSDLADLSEYTLKETADLTKNSVSLALEVESQKYDVIQKVKALQQLIRTEVQVRYELYELKEALSQAVGNYQTTLAQGLRIAEERIAYRRGLAATTQQARYNDMAFRIFQNDALQKYRAQFDLAARYVYLAAKAYDYETCLLGSDTRGGQQFLTDIIRQRSLGQIIGGVPFSGSIGLTDPLARLDQNFVVLKGQLGFNTAAPQTNRFSLRTGHFRISGTNTTAWKAALASAYHPNLWDVPEFRKYCRPFDSNQNTPQPGLVVEFDSTITAGLNFFGWPLGAEPTYNPSRYATKVRSAGIAFTDYSGAGLTTTPYVYLVPAGNDIMRTPTGSTGDIRSFSVVDQKLPLPFPIGNAGGLPKAWIPANDTLGNGDAGDFGGIRQFSSIQAFDDRSGTSEFNTDTRLIGRSVWNTRWMLIVPGASFLADPNTGLDTFINSVSDIKIFFQTYAYSGN